MPLPDLQHTTLSVCEIVKATGSFLSGENEKIIPGDVEVKSRNSLVTYVDKESERRLVEELRKIVPDAGFITEENTVPVSEKELQWIIDPLDGTTNYIHSIPCYSISVALVKGIDILLGVVFEINREECFYTWKGAGSSFLNGRPVQVSKTPELSQSLIATGFPYSDYGKMKPYLETLEHFMRNTRGIRRYGSAAVDLAWVACGRFDGFFEYGLNSWDVAAGILLVRESGGIASGFLGMDNCLFDKEIAVSNPVIFNNFLSVIEKKFYTFRG